MTGSIFERYMALTAIMIYGARAMIFRMRKEAEPSGLVNLECACWGTNRPH